MVSWPMVSWPVACGLWLVACGLWPVACGLWLVACGLWPVACGLWLVAYGLMAYGLMACGLWPVACGLWPHDLLTVLDLAEQVRESFPACYTAQKYEFILPLWRFHQKVGVKGLLNFL